MIESIEVDIKSAVAAIRGINDRQIPFATALSLTRVAQDVQSEVRRQLPTRFTIRNSYVEKGIVISKATKQQLFATVVSRAPFMVIQETGGTKAPAGQHVAVPQSVRRNKRDIVTRANRPSGLLGNPRVFKATIRGITGLWQRPATKRGALRLLYALVPSVVVRPRFGFFETAKRVARERFPRQFAVAFLNAVRTAR